MKPTLGRAFSFWMVGALALVALMAPTVADAQEPETALVEVATYGCTGLAAPGLLTEVGSDCTDVGGSYDFYLYGDGTDDSWSMTDMVGESNAIALIPGDYQVYENTYGVLFDLTVPAEGTSIAFGIPVAGSEPVPPTEPEPPVAETATLEVTTYACTGVVGAPIALVDIGPDCTPISTNLDFYLWGDGTDASWNLTTSADGPVTIDLAVGGYQVVDTTTWATLGTQVPSGGASLAIGYAAEPAPPVVETAVMNVEVYSCTGVTGTAIVLGEIGPDCVRVSTDLEFYLWGDGTDDHATLTTDANGTVAVELPVGGYEVWDVTTWQKVGVNVPAEGGTVAIGIPAADFGVTP